MTLNFDAEQPVVGLRSQQALIKAVLAASSADESRWLEWKSGLDVSKPAGAFAVARTILGFANRMPDVAVQWAGGHAYMLVGVEEGELNGVTPHDVEKVDPWLARYLGDFDRYQFTYVPYDNRDGPRQVMLVDVSPPRWGDPIYPLCKACADAYAGTVFHRYPGRTQPAQPREIQSLTERARRAVHRISVDVALSAGTVAIIPATDDIRGELLSVMREEMLEQLETGGEVGRAGGRNALAFGPQANAFRYLSSLDPRSPDDFRKEVEQYLRDFDLAMQQTLALTVGSTGIPLRLKLSNPGESFLAKVEVVLRLPDTVQAHVVDEDEEVDWPTEPKAYRSGSVPIAGMGFPYRMGPLPTMYSPDIDHEEGHTIIRFAPVDLRPHESVPLDPIALFSTAGTEEPVAGQWRATATNMSGSVQQQLLIPAQRLDVDARTALLGPQEQ